MSSKLLFLGYIISAEGIHINEKKMRATRDWFIPRNITKVWSFHGLMILYMRFVRNFSSIMASITESALKKEQIFWGKKG